MRTIINTLLTAQTAATRTPYIYMLFTMVKTAATIAFVSATKKITDSGNSLDVFKTGDTIVVTGSVSNNGTYTVATGDVAGEIVVIEALADEGAGATVTITETRDLSMDSAAFGNRMLFVEHIEEVYNDYAVVLLRNSDKSIPSVKGYWTEIGYGDTTGGGNEYAGDGSNGGARASSRLWVKSQQTVSAAGKLYTILELEGMWSQLREVLVRLGSAPLYQSNYSATTAYAILEALIETEMGWTLDALGDQDDSLINTIALDFDANNQVFEYMAGMLYRLLRLTKTFLLPKASNTFEVRYPQSGDSVDLAFVSNTTPNFYSYTNRDIVHVPNRVYVYANSGGGDWGSFVTGDEQDTPSLNAYREIVDIALAPDITTSGDADLLSAALLSKIKAESVVGIGLVPHHCAVELLDKLTFTDNRVSQNVYPADGTVRVGGLKHTYRPGHYRLQITLGGQSVTGEVARLAGQQLLAFNDSEVRQADTEAEVKEQRKAFRDAEARQYSSAARSPTRRSEALAVPQPISSPVPEIFEPWIPREEFLKRSLVVSFEPRERNDSWVTVPPPPNIVLEPIGSGMWQEREQPGPQPTSHVSPPNIITSVIDLIKGIFGR